MIDQLKEIKFGEIREAIEFVHQALIASGMTEQEVKSMDVVEAFRLYCELMSHC